MNEKPSTEVVGAAPVDPSVTVTEVSTEGMTMPQQTPTQVAFRMLMGWAREHMPDGNQRLSEGLLCAACMHMVSMLTAVYSNEPGVEDPLPELLTDIQTMFADYKQTDALRRAQPKETVQ
jgi:hypothetical protein